MHLQNNNMDKNHKRVNPVKTKATNNIIILKNYYWEDILKNYYWEEKGNEESKTRSKINIIVIIIMIIG